MDIFFGVIITLIIYGTLYVALPLAGLYLVVKVIKAALS